jgi:hypothetical protein
VGTEADEGRRVSRGAIEKRDERRGSKWFNRLLDQLVDCEKIKGKFVHSLGLLNEKENKKERN